MSEDGFVFLMFIVGVILGVCLGMSIIHSLVSVNEITDLGSAICDQEYNMTFDSYLDGELSCKPGIVKQEYDGLKVQLVSSTT